MKNIDLINDERVKQIIDGLESEIIKSEPVIDEIMEDTLAKISSWKYATDEYFSPIPLFHEINRFKRGKLLKDVKERKVPGLFSFGFDENNQLILTQSLVGENITFGYANNIYRYSETGEILRFHTRSYENKERQTKLISAGIFKELESSVKIDITLSRSKDWSAFAYFYNLERVEKIVGYSKGWSGMTTYEMVYDEKGLAKIMLGYQVYWKRR